MGAIPQIQAPAVVHAAAGGRLVGVPAKNGPADSTSVDLFHGDCLDGIATMSDESVDIVVTSPPYNLGVKYGRYHDDRPRDQYLDWCDRWGREVKRVLVPNGSLFVVVGASPSNHLLPHQLALRFSNFFVLQNEITWIKSVTLDQDGGDVVSRGHFKPINSQRFLNDCHETVFHFTKTGKVRVARLAIGVPYNDKSNVARWGHTGGADLRCRGNTWFIPYKTIRSGAQERPHPATIPLKLAEMCIRLHGHDHNTVVLDPFVGIGGAALAAKDCGVGRFIGFDIDEDYLHVAAERTGGALQKLPNHERKL